MVPALFTYQITKRHMVGVSLLIHLMLLLWLLGFVHTQNKKNALSNPTPLIPKTKTDDTWASTNARRSAPVIFKKMPSQSPATHTTSLASAPSTTSTTSSSLESDAPTSNTSINEPDTSQTRGQPIEQHAVAQEPKIEKPISKPEPQPSAIFAQAARNALYKQSSPAYTPRAAQQEQAQTQSAQPKAQSQPQRPASQPTSAPAKPMLSMAHIAQGFSQYSKEEGEYTINVIGDPRKLPTDQQLRQHHYIEKLLQCLHASGITLKHKMPMMNPALIQDFPITMMIHRDGSISDLRVVRSSNFASVDTFYLELFADASNSFPPLPSYFTHNSYRMNWLIIVK